MFHGGVGPIHGAGAAQGHRQGMCCSALPGRALPSQRMVTAKSFVKYSLCCLGPLAQGLMELLAPAMQPPAERALEAFQGPPKPAGEEVTFQSCFLLGSTHACVSGAVVITRLCFSSRKAGASVVFWKGRLAALPAVVTQNHPTAPHHLLLLLCLGTGSSSFAVRCVSCGSCLSAVGWIPRQAGTSVLQEPRHPGDGGEQRVKAGAGFSPSASPAETGHPSCFFISPQNGGCPHIPSSHTFLGPQEAGPERLSTL